MSPQLGVGAQLAMEDAAVLANMLSGHPDLSAALQAYTLARQAKVRPYQQASRWLTPLFQSDSRLLASMRDRLLSSPVTASWGKRFAHDIIQTWQHR
jgi:2-polyprenyl-6-methoxyphenol hydroxylase-like FAD-dependent oxidoreductase